MELREYLTILRRRWWIPLALAGLIAILSGLQLRPWQPPPVSYSASMRLLLGVMPASDADTTAYDPRYYAWLTSEYLVDDFTEVVRSELFARNVNARLAEAVQVTPGAIQGSAATGKQHRIITLSFGWGNREQAIAIAQAAADELIENAATYFRQLGTDGASIALLDGPSVGEVGPSLRNRLEFPLRILLGLLVGIGLIFLFEYLDTSIRGRQDLEELGFTILAEIPRK